MLVQSIENDAHSARCARGWHWRSLRTAHVSWCWWLAPTRTRPLWPGLCHPDRTGVCAELRGSTRPIATGGVHLRMRAWYNPDLESRTYNVPAVIDAVLLLMPLLLTALEVCTS